MRHFVLLKTVSLSAVLVCLTFCSDRHLYGQLPKPETRSLDRTTDQLRFMQQQATTSKFADWGHWGNQPNQYHQWDQHSNRLIPVYTFGLTLNQWRETGSVYKDVNRLQELYGKMPLGSVNPHAEYYDQTDIYKLQKQAVEQGYRHIILMVFDGMDWQTTHAAASYKQGMVPYSSGRGRGLQFLDDQRVKTDFALVCTSARLGKVTFDVNAQTVIAGSDLNTGGYDPKRGGHAPWAEPTTTSYLIGRDREQPHTVTDSASSATSMTSGIKTYNGAINYSVEGEQVVPIARQLQNLSFKTGIVTSVPISHATPASAYANNVTRKDYQDISRDMLGLRSVSHRNKPLIGLDVIIGGGWSPDKSEDRGQGSNYQPGNKYLHQSDLAKANVDNGGNYVVATRTSNLHGDESLKAATKTAISDGKRLLGFFGTQYDGHLPYQTADGNYDPASDLKGQETYSKADRLENPNLAQMTEAALDCLSANGDKFWLMIEAGDVDWANHANNLDNSIGAVFSGEAAFKAVMDWADEHQAWDHTAVIVTSDHGHFFVNRQPETIASASSK